jgi:RNA polymerase sigma-70 factor, ECF subfamily
MNEDGRAPRMDRQQETTWVRAFLAGDRSAFDKLVLAHQDRVFSLCYRLLGDYEEAGDCAQEAFLKAYRSLKSFRFGSSFATWLYAIAVNTCKNRLKSAEFRSRKRMVPLDDPLEDDEGGKTVRQLEDPAPSPLAQLALKERERLLQGAIDALPADARVVVVLRDIEGLSYEDIVLATGYNMGTLKSKLARAREQLRKRLKGVV